jgi:hypothetical protein
MAYGWFGLGNIGASAFIEQQHCGHSQYLTIQALGVSALTMALSIVTDVIPSQTLEDIKRIFLMVSLPLSVVVSTIYWTLLTFAAHLLMPEQWSTTTSEPSSSNAGPILMRIPLPVDLALHAVPCIALAINFFAFERKYGLQAMAQLAPVVTAVVALWYMVWVERCATLNGFFPYPFLNTSFVNRAIIYVASTCLAFYSFKFLNWIHWENKRPDLMFKKLS